MYNGLINNQLKNMSKTTAKDFFLYLAVFVGLYASTISFQTLAFSIIEKIFPLSNEYYADPDMAIRNTVAVLIIFLPAFIYVSKIVNKDLKNNPDKKEIWIRRWLIYFTLFVAGIAVAVDLVILIQRFLSADDMTLRFILKVILVLITTASIFRYYLYDLKRDASEFKKGAKIFVWTMSCIALVAIIYGIVLVGTPSEQRAKRMDSQRINDLRNIQNEVVYTHWQNKGDIPSKLEEMNDPISGFIVPTDPETKENYTYKKLSKNSFELCATFRTSASTTVNSISGKETSQAYPYGTRLENENWSHEATTTCFKRVIDEKIYQVDIKKGANLVD